ncbi:hypothetical protein P23_1060 [Acinetobacter calcoaceticus]|nr:hypothetical protein P23_1060 [Acinetobacter calcoaceticus]
MKVLFSITLEQHQWTKDSNSKNELNGQVISKSISKFNGQDREADSITAYDFIF